MSNSSLSIVGEIVEEDREWDEVIDHIVRFGQVRQDVPLLKWTRTARTTAGHRLRLNVPVFLRPRWRIHKIDFFLCYHHGLHPIAYRSDAVQIYPSRSLAAPFAVYDRQSERWLETDREETWNFTYLETAMQAADALFAWNRREPYACSSSAPW